MCLPLLTRPCSLLIEIIVISALAKGVVARATSVVGGAAVNATLRELEVGAGSSVLHLLGKGFIAADLNVRDGSACHLHGLLEVAASQLGYRILKVVVIDFHASILHLLGALNFSCNRFLDGE